MILLQVLLLFVSMTAIYFAAGWTLKSAERIGSFYKASPLLIGIFVIGFGTSLPEFFVSQFAAFRGEMEVGLGNLIGSNLANLFFVIGLTAFIYPFQFSHQDLKKDFSDHLLLTFLWVTSLSMSYFSVYSAFALLLFMVYFFYRKFIRDGHVHGPDEYPIPIILGPKDYVVLSFGLVFLYLGSELLVFSVKNLAEILSISSYIISAILVALGTSVPEIVVSMMIIFKKKDPQMILGNIIGSNIFNVSFVFLSLFPYKVIYPQTFYLESILLLLGSLYLFLRAQKTLNRSPFHRKEGLLFMGLYFGMILYWLL